MMRELKGRRSCNISERVASRSISVSSPATPRGGVHARCASDLLRRDTTLAPTSAWTDLEWRRSLACKLYEERQPVLPPQERQSTATLTAAEEGKEEEMDLLWEAYAANAGEEEPEIKQASTGNGEEEGATMKKMGSTEDLQVEDGAKLTQLQGQQRRHPSLEKLRRLLRRAAAVRRLRCSGAAAATVVGACYGLRPARNLGSCCGHVGSGSAGRVPVKDPTRGVISPPHDSMSRA